jgi:uncharacterized surface protein with fasciclin (FAS1) repeats
MMQSLAVFAPSNDAFAKLDRTTLDFLRSEEGADALENILLYHVVSGLAYADGVSVDDTVTTLEGSAITVTEAGNTIVINGVSTVLEADVLARNGVIHVVGKLFRLVFILLRNQKTLSFA